MRVVVDYDNCNSNALCVAAAPRCSRCATTTSSTCSRTNPAPSCATRWRKPSASAPPRRSRSPTDRGRERRHPPYGRWRSSGCRAGAGLRAAETLRAPASTGASARSAPSRTCPTTARRCRRSCSPGSGSRTMSSCASRASTTSTSSGDSGAARCHSDLGEREVALDGGNRVDFDGLVIATGSEPRRLPIPEGTAALDGVFVLRTLDDALAIRSRLDAKPRVVRDRGRLHRCRGRGDVSRPRARGHRARGAAATDGARARDRDRRGLRGAAPRPRRRPAPRSFGRGDRRRRDASGGCALADER